MNKKYHCPESDEHTLVFKEIITVGVISKILFDCLDCLREVLLEDEEMDYLPRKVLKLRQEYPS